MLVLARGGGMLDGGLYKYEICTLVLCATSWNQLGFQRQQLARTYLYSDHTVSPGPLL